jgi:hypothetical protein
VKNAQDAYALLAASSGVDKYSLIPASMVAQCVEECVVGASPQIEVTMFPATANKSKVFIPINHKGELEQDGTVKCDEAGVVKVSVVPTQNSGLYQRVEIKFREAVARETEDGQTRETEDGETMEC